jgi:hypothetical protein
VNKDAPPVQHHETTVCANLPALLVLAVACLTQDACAKRNTLPEQELFQRIQVFEERIATAQMSVHNATGCREAHAPSEEGVCDPSVELCALTAETANKDALRRCLMASDSCRSARERARALCASPGRP